MIPVTGTMASLLSPSSLSEPRTTSLKPAPSLPPPLVSIASVVPAADGKATNNGDGTEKEHGNHDQALDGELGDFSEKGHGPLPVGRRRGAARPLHGLTQPAGGEKNLCPVPALWSARRREGLERGSVMVFTWLPQPPAQGRGGACDAAAPGSSCAQAGDSAAARTSGCARARASPRVHFPRCPACREWPTRKAQVEPAVHFQAVFGVHLHVRPDQAQVAKTAVQTGFFHRPAMPPAAVLQAQACHRAAPACPDSRRARAPAGAGDGPCRRRLF